VFPADFKGQKMMGISDARQVTDRMVFAPPAAQGLLPLLNGERTIQQIADEFGQGLGVDNLQHLVVQLDQAGLLEGPTFELMLARMHADFDATDNLPPAATAAFTESLGVELSKNGADEGRPPLEPGQVLKDALDDYISRTLANDPNPPLEDLPRGIIVPHLDYPRGWVAYATIWGRMRGLPRPDRVVILGTNHFGVGTGITICDKGYATDLGVCPVDATLLAALQKRLGPENAAKSLKNRYDHEREHSIELQVPWVQACIGPDAQGHHVPVLGILVHDPTVNQGESYDGKGLGLDPFVEALSAAIKDVGGRTLVVSSADLSHVGPMFGDEVPLAGEAPEVMEFRNRVSGHDRQLLSLVAANKPDDLFAAMAWQQNPTRWCSVGNIIAGMKVVRPVRVDVYRYAVALDPQGMSLVTCVGAVMR